MTRSKLLSEINYALSFIEYNSVERKEIKKAFKKLKKDLQLGKIYKKENNVLNEYILQLLKENYKLKKALSIIYNKGVYVRHLIKSKDIIEFLYWCKLIDPLLLEEYDLIKEVLENV